jgi:hypothetical protein
VTRYASPRYAMGISEQATKSHPWGKGAGKKYSAEGLVNHAEREGFSDKFIYHKLDAIGKLTGQSKFKEGARIARMRAHRKGEFKGD